MKALPRRPKPPLRSSVFLSQQPTPLLHSRRPLSNPSRTTRLDRENELTTLRSTLRDRIRTERVSRREDWFLGPLAPRRDAGKKGKDVGVVAVTEFMGRGEERRRMDGEVFGKGVGRGKNGKNGKVRRKVVERLGEGKEALGRAGRWYGWEECLVEVGDRVVVVGKGGVEGRDRGMIGKVIEVRKVEGEVVVEGLNLADVTVPAATLASEPAAPPTRTVPLPIPFASIRLIHPLTYNNIYRDCIIEKLVRRPNDPRRYIANSQSFSPTGSLIEIPWPEKEDEEEEKVDHDDDTLRYQVEEETWVPTLLRAPMPEGVIDELRYKYSKHRTRHEPSYLAMKLERERKRAQYKSWAKSGGGMLMTPWQEAKARARAKAQSEGKSKLKGRALNKEVLVRIGRVMREQGIQLTEKRIKAGEENVVKEEVLARVGGGEERKVRKKVQLVEAKGTEEGEWVDVKEREEFVEMEGPGRESGEARI